MQCRRRGQVEGMGDRVTSQPMSAHAFMTRFGASCRKKHLMPPDGRSYPVASESKLPKRVIRLDPWEAEYLFLVASLAHEGIVEIGRLHGGSTFLLSCANAEVPIWSIDLEPVSDDQLEGWFAQHGVGANVHLLVGDSHWEEFPEIGELDLVFVDGDHSYEGCRADLDSYFSKLAPGGHVLVHDCYDGCPVQRAVLDFVLDEEVEVVRSPYIPATHWHTDSGSLAHLRKRATVG
jgi:predicted O-methyltransferase YrrM